LDNSFKMFRKVVRKRVRFGTVVYEFGRLAEELIHPKLQFLLGVSNVAHVTLLTRGFIDDN